VDHHFIDTNKMVGIALRTVLAAKTAVPLAEPGRPTEGQDKPANGRVAYGQNNAEYLTARIARYRLWQIFHN
jgi:hypothetical protein